MLKCGTWPFFEEIYSTTASLSLPHLSFSHTVPLEYDIKLWLWSSKLNLVN